MNKNQLRHLRRGMEILRRQGLTAFMNKVKVKLAERRASFVIPGDDIRLTFNELDGEACQALENPPEKFLAVQLHLYYEDLLDEFVRSLSNISIPFDLFISIQDRGSENAVHQQEITEKCRAIPHLNQLQIRPTENRGRDIAPMYVLFGRELEDYKYVLHLHSKKSLYTGKEQEDWRQFSVQTLIGDKETAARLIRLMETHPEIGLAYPERYEGMAPEAYSWLSDEEKGRNFLESLGIPFSSGVFLYPAGSFFLIRNEAIRQIWNRHLTYSDFDPEASQTDGTLAHVLERAVSKVCRYNGYHDAILSSGRREVHVDWDKQAFLPVFRRDRTNLKLDLMAYDVISFDIFDTLLTRELHHPVDLFWLMEKAEPGRREANRVSGAESNQLNHRFDAEKRILAEIEANHSFGAKTSIRQIYSILKESMHWSETEMEHYLQEEIDLERELLSPRRDMVDLWNQLRKKGKRLILVSDMYLPKDIIEDILSKNGIQGYEALYISCEEGLRKDDGSLWEKVLTDYQGMNLAHVGDNLQSDWQELSDRNEKTCWIMNPRDEERIDGQSACESKINDPIMQSIVKGLTCNLGAYNSPFALSTDGQFRFHDSYTFGWTAFGPLFYEFITWIHNKARENEVQMIAFLAREGYIFRQLYQIIFGDQALPSCYLLTSRRSVSVAAIRTEEDIMEILRRDYDGSLRNLLVSRLGYPQEKAEHFPDRQVHFKKGASDDDFSKTIEKIRAIFPEVISYAKEERTSYLGYLDQMFPSNVDRDKVLLVDIGYSGTIQYWMSRLLESPVAAAYLAVFQKNEKLAENHCPIASMYGPESPLTLRSEVDQETEQKENSGDFIKDIEETQLFLESVLQAPYGQLIRFRGRDPEYRKEAKPSEGIQDLQNGILDYARARGRLESLRYGSVDQVPKEILQQARKGMEEIYRKYIHQPLTEQLASIFSVDDNYSQDTCLHLDPKTGKWVI
ncbi:MAG: rhamnan synthesis F family protein [Lachnospiraceae bacterium]|nr:rhamnan synthesis F family protein [Lachnospiraceae bacterium]